MTATAFPEEGYNRAYIEKLIESVGEEKRLNGRPKKTVGGSHIQPDEGHEEEDDDNYNDDLWEAGSAGEDGEEEEDDNYDDDDEDITLDDLVAQARGAPGGTSGRSSERLSHVFNDSNWRDGFDHPKLLDFEEWAVDEGHRHQGWRYGDLPRLDGPLLTTYLLLEQ